MSDPYVIPARCAQCDGAGWIVAEWHRHSDPVVGHLFTQGVADDDGAVRGVVIIGRPVARGLQDGWTAEVLRVATDGCPWDTPARRRIDRRPHIDKLRWEACA
ncbi:MAG: hypothetical protein M3Y91_06695 [Actinomycetota bacterium]|nr:hypothetical protein [Actinomycetota bacterium]